MIKKINYGERDNVLATQLFKDAVPCPFLNQENAPCIFINSEMYPELHPEIAHKKFHLTIVFLNLHYAHESFLKWFN